MNKNRFILIIILGLTILIFLFKTYIDTKKEAIQNYQYHQQLLQKIKEINYLKKTYNNLKILHNLNMCNITKDEKIIIECKNLSAYKFKKASKIIFNSNLNIDKFKITPNSIYVEVLK